MLFKKKEEEILPNEYDLKLKELSNIIVSNKAQLRCTIKELKRIDEVKHSFIIYTDFNKKADEEYDNLLKDFEKIAKNLTTATKNYNKYLTDNINYFAIYKDCFTEPDSENVIYNIIKANIIDD